MFRAPAPVSSRNRGVFDDFSSSADPRHSSRDSILVVDRHGGHSGYVSASSGDDEPPLLPVVRPTSSSSGRRSDGASSEQFAAAAGTAPGLFRDPSLRIGRVAPPSGVVSVESLQLVWAIEAEFQRFLLESAPVSWSARLPANHVLLLLLGSNECAPRGNSRLFLPEFRADPVAIRIILGFLRLHISSFVDLRNVVLR